MYKPPLSSQRKHSSDGYHHLIRALRAHFPLKGKAKSARFCASAKNKHFAISFPLYSPSHSSIKFRATACAKRRDSKGAEPLCPWGSQGNRGTQAFLGKSLRLFHLDQICGAFSLFAKQKDRSVPVQMAYILKLYYKASCNEERKKFQPIIRIIRSTHQNETPPHSSPDGDTFPSRGRQKALAFARARKRQLF